MKSFKEIVRYSYLKMCKFGINLIILFYYSKATFCSYAVSSLIQGSFLFKDEAYIALMQRLFRPQINSRLKYMMKEGHERKKDESFKSCSIRQKYIKMGRIVWYRNPKTTQYIVFLSSTTHAYILSISLSLSLSPELPFSCLIEVQLYIIPYHQKSFKN